MPFVKGQKRINPNAKVTLYGLDWLPTLHPVQREIEMIRNGGQWIGKRGQTLGNGLFWHYKRLQQLLWPEKQWHRWNELQLKCFLENKYVGEMACAAAGKSDHAASDVLADWLCFPECTSVLVSSTDLKSLELRIWGMIKKYFKSAKERFDWIPGHLIEGKQMLILDSREECSAGRDFKNGIIAVAAKRGNQFVGLGPLIGIHNKRVRLVADELSLMPRAFIDSTSNLSKCEDFKCIGLGNPNETTNAHGVLCEPAPELGGWEGGIDQTPGTKTWKTRWPNGIAIQLPGSDSPNMDVPAGTPPPYPFLMTRQQMEDDARIWGKDDWHYTMMNEARMPRGQGSRRVITRQACEKFGALLEPIWRDSNQKSVAFLDAAYRGVGGDRCVFGELKFGLESEEITPVKLNVPDIVNQSTTRPEGRQIIALVDLMIIPIAGEIGEDTPEDQIVRFVKQQCANRGIGPENFFFDSGMRTSLVTAFSRQWSAMVNSIDCGGKPTEQTVSSEIKTICRDYYSKFVTELWFSFRLCVESRQFRGLTTDAMWEFSSREWKLTSGNKIEVESKDDMKVKTGRSPDLADSIAVGVFGARQRGFTISRMTANAPKQKRGPDWRDEIKKRADALRGKGQLQYA